MKRITSTAAALLFATTAFAFTGCDEGDDGMVGGKVYPKAGSTVNVQLRRDFLGYNTTGTAAFNGGTASPLVGAMGEGAPQPVGVGGVLKRMSDDFVVLQVGDPNVGRELWITRDAILMLDVTPPAKQ